MLTSLRGFVGSWAAKILLVLLVGSFALWGISGSLLGEADRTTVATIGETRVPVGEYLAAYNRNMNQIQQQTRQRLTREQARIFGVEQRALNDVVAFGTLDEYARRAGLALSDDTLARLIGQTEAFQDSTGKFNRDTFRRAVFEAQMRESDFIEAQNEAAVRGQLTKGFATGDILPKVFTDALGQFGGEERVFEYVTVTTAIATPVAQPDDATLSAWFEENKQTYRAPEYRKLTLLELTPERIADESAVSEADARADYEARLSAYRQPERRKVEQAVFKDRASAEAASQKLKDGAIFETVMQEAGITPAELGLMTKEALPAAIAEAVFAAPLNEATDVIDGPFGATIARVSDIQTESTQPFEEVQAEIRKDIALRRAAERIIGLQENIEDIRAGGATLAEAADQFDLKTRTIDSIDASAQTKDGTIISNIPSSRELIQRAFAANKGEQTNPIDVGTSGYVWFEVADIEEARDRTLDEVRDRAEADWITQRKAEAVQAKAEELEKRMKAGATLQAIAQDNALDVVKTSPLKRNADVSIFPRAAVQQGFAGDANHIFTAEAPEAGNIILARVDSITAGQEPVGEEQIDLANQGAADDLLNKLIANLQGEYAVTQNQAAIDYALTNR